MSARDPAVVAASLGFLSRRCAKEANAKNEKAFGECTSREIKALDKACHKQLTALTECLADKNGSCAKPDHDLRECVQSNFGIDLSSRT